MDKDTTNGNDLFLKNGKAGNTGNTEAIISDTIHMAEEVKKKDRVVIVGLLLRPSGAEYGNNKAVSINWLLKKYLENSRVEFLGPPLDYFYGKGNLFQRDSTDLDCCLSAFTR